MQLLAVIRREERRLEKQRRKIERELDALRGAMKALGRHGGRGKKRGRRKMSAAARARIAKAQRLRWAKVRQANNKAKS